MAEEEARTWFPAGVLPAEVVFFLFKIGEALLEPSVRLYITEGVCRQTLAFHNQSSSKCSRLNQYPDEEDSVQSTAANYLMYYKLIINRSFPRYQHASTVSVTMTVTLTLQQ